MTDKGHLHVLYTGFHRYLGNPLAREDASRLGRFYRLRFSACGGFLWLKRRPRLEAIIGIRRRANTGTPFGKTRARSLSAHTGFSGNAMRHLLLGESRLSPIQAVARCRSYERHSLASIPNPPTLKYHPATRLARCYRLKQPLRACLFVSTTSKTCGCRNEQASQHDTACWTFRVHSLSAHEDSLSLRALPGLVLPLPKGITCGSIYSRVQERTNHERETDGGH